MAERTPIEVIKTQGTFRKIAFANGEHRLMANIYTPLGGIDGQTPGVFFIHGGGERGKAIAKRLQQYLCDNGFASFAYDSTGVRESEGTAEQETLADRQQDATTALQVSQQYVDPMKTCVIGMSMGADTAITLLRENPQIRTLILLAPAAYADESKEEPITDGFTRRIRRDKQSWQNASTFSNLEAYGGSILIIYGELDKVIPGKMRKRFREIVQNKGGKFVTIGNALHNFLRPHDQVERQSQQQVFGEVLTFLTAHLLAQQTTNQ